MLRTPIPSQPGYDYVVTSLTAGDAQAQETASAWAALKMRLHVNAGCGSVVVDEMRVCDHNPAWLPIRSVCVPPHIVADFQGAT